MASERSGGSNNRSDQKLDEAATAEREARMQGRGPEHDPEKIRKHNDTGADRLFEDRQQHDEAEKNSEKTRKARDVERHHHTPDEQIADAGTWPSAKQKN